MIPLPSNPEAAGGIAAAGRAIGALITAAKRGGEEGLRKGAIEVHARVVRKLSQHGSGRVYPARRSRGQNRTAPHQASAPGEPPAVDTGLYRASWQFDFGVDARGPWSEVGTPMKIGPWLEFGTSRMAPRPHLRPVLDEYARDLGRVVAAEVVAEEQRAMREIRGLIREIDL